MSSKEGTDLSRRRFLTATTSVVGAVGGAVALVPFISSMQPSARAQAAGAPVQVDISQLEPGGRLTVEWRGKPVWIVRRTKENLKDLDDLAAQLRDPDSEISDQQPTYAQNPIRARKENPEIAVLIGICTHLGCSPTYRPDIGPADLGADWKGGFFCPCHGSRFDLAGRVYSGVPAPTNLPVPPYAYLNATTLLIGDDKESA
ncbi:MAG: ubiquinol-cytochrome c reductase iron-sulfur subunit [Thiotrichales bacterium SG8_50]|nr:MAG: ubiquinol-cytochrome c reductase iron-sulfur subunit [Thiotrichales bacterium SG8_50]